MSVTFDQALGQGEQTTGIKLCKQVSGQQISANSICACTASDRVNAMVVWKSNLETMWLTSFAILFETSEAIDHHHPRSVVLKPWPAKQFSLERKLYIWII